MKQRYLSRAYLIAGLATLAILVWPTVVSPPAPDRLSLGVLFGAVIVFADVFGAPLAGAVVSLLPMATVAAYLVIGPAATGWAAFAGALIHGELRYRWAEQLRLPRVTSRAELVTIGAANATAHTVGALAGGAAFQALGWNTPLSTFELSGALPLMLFALTYLAANHLVFLPTMAARGREVLQHS
jgi:hypothetical protein